MNNPLATEIVHVETLNMASKEKGKQQGQGKADKNPTGPTKVNLTLKLILSIL